MTTESTAARKSAWAFLVRSATTVLVAAASWVLAAYATALPRATLVCLPDAGHIAALDQPDTNRRVVEAFLLDRPLPIPATPQDEPCHP